MRAIAESPPSLHLVHRCTAASTSARGLWLVRPFFPTWPNKKGTNNACLKRDLFLFFIALLDFYFYFSHFPAHSFIFFSPIDSPERPMAVPGLRKKCAGSYARGVIFSHQTAANSVEKNVQKENPRAAVTGEDFFFLSRKYHVRCGCACVGVCVCVCVQGDNGIFRSRGLSFAVYRWPENAAVCGTVRRTGLDLVSCNLLEYYFINIITYLFNNKLLWLT